MGVHMKAAKETLKDALKAIAVIASILAAVAVFIGLIVFAPWALAVIAGCLMLGGAYLENLKEAKEEENE